MRAAFLSLVAATVTATGAFADWRYCYGVDFERQLFHISKAAPTLQPFDAVNEAFRQVLKTKGIKAENIACPRAADEAEIKAHADFATAYNRRNGSKVVPLEWSPGDAGAAPRPRQSNRAQWRWSDFADMLLRRLAPHEDDLGTASPAS